jgi:hypothetical protein
MALFTAMNFRLNTTMRTPIILLLSLLSVSSIRAAHVTIDVMFTNRTVVGDTFTRNSVTVRWTNAPLNSTTWITTNSVRGSATSLWNHLGANMGGGRWRVSMTSPTNVLISGTDAQFDLGASTYAVLTTNNYVQTNGVIVTLNGDPSSPLKYHAATNQTNIANELAMLQKLRASDAIQMAANSNNFYKVPRVSGGSSTNEFITNSPSIQTTNLTTARLTATSGEINGVNATNVPVLTAISGFLRGMYLDEPQLTNAVAWNNIYIGSTNTGTPTIWAIQQPADNLLYLYSDDALGAVLSIDRRTGDTITTLNANGTGLTTNFGTFYADSIYTPTLVGTNTTISSLTAGAVSAARYSQSGPWTFTEGAYTGMTGGSNNVSQASTNAWTRLSGHVSACNLNSMRTADGLPMSGRRHGIVNAGSFDITLIDTLSDGFETLNTNEMDLGGINITLAPKARAEFQYNASSARWEILYPQPPTNLIVKSTGDFAGTDTTNIIAFNAQQIRRMTNAMTTNHTFIISNVLAGSSVEIYLTGANGGVIASNYTFTLRTNLLPTASRITWRTNGVALTNGTYDYAVPSNSYARVILTAPFATNVFAAYEVGP